MAVVLTECEPVPVRDYRMRAAPGVVVVEPHRRPESQNGVYIPESVVTDAPLATVIAVGGKHGNHDPSKSLKVGDIVFVRRDRGDVYACFGWDSSITDGDIVAFGQNGGPGSSVKFSRYAWDEAVLAIMEDAMRPIGRNILVKMGERATETEGGIQLLWSKRDPVCDVIAIGSDVREVAPGQKCVVSQNSLVVVDGKAGLAICIEDAVQMVMI